MDLRSLRVREQLLGLIQLTRWKEYVPFVVPITLLGALLAIRPQDTSLDWKLVTVTLANVFAVMYAFMINDIEDAPDDARDPARAARNPVSSGLVTVRVGYAACRIVAALTLCLYATGGLYVLIIGIATVLLSHLYSWKPVRLKAWPVTDILSHSLMLSGLLLLAGYFIYHAAPGMVWFVAACATLFSVYGQLYNQLRDYDMDKAAGLFNTAMVLGADNTRRAMYLSIALGVVCLLVAIVQGVFPVWLAGVLAIAVGIALLFRPQTDMRGGVVVEASGNIQIPFLIVLNVTMFGWLAIALVQQFLPFLF